MKLQPNAIRLVLIFKTIIMEIVYLSGKQANSGIYSQLFSLEICTQFEQGKPHEKHSNWLFHIRIFN